MANANDVETNATLGFTKNTNVLEEEMGHEERDRILTLTELLLLINACQMELMDTLAADSFTKYILQYNIH